MGEEKKDEQLRLPDLNPLLKLYPATKGKDGSPNWVLFYPASNKYYKVSWAEFECIARFHKHETAEELVKSINKETTLDITVDDIKALIIFLSQNGLLKPSQQIKSPNAEKDNKQPLWKTAIHKYLFFTIPILRPQDFLDKSYPLIRPLISKTFWYLSLLILLIGISLTLPKLDQFLGTFTHIFSLEGLILTTLIFTLIKIVHEFGHAYMARHHNVPVPHMGVAFMVMYPVLYTEMSGTWRVASHKSRMMMGLAGVMTEIALAGIFLIYWHLTPSILGQSIAFSVVTISLVGTFLINLNPFMRFDGYYVLSDYWGIENLHQTAIAHTKNWIRNNIFGLNEELDSDYNDKTRAKLIWFGLGTITYRFFLYLGIALLVYYVFFKPLGLILMIIELTWFIALPLLKELGYLGSKLPEIIRSKQSIIVAILSLFLVLWAILPSQTSIQTDAVLHPQNYTNIYPPSAAKIEKLLVNNDQTVSKGDVLAILNADKIDQDLAIAETKLQELNRLKRREQTNVENFRENRALIDLEISEAQQEVKSLKNKQNKLNITADFDGVIKDIPHDYHEDRFIKQDRLLLRLVSPEKLEMTAYIEENNVSRIQENDHAAFTPDYSLLKKTSFIVKDIESTNIENLPWKELSAQHGGTLATQEKDNENKTLKSYYKVTLEPAAATIYTDQSSMILRGKLKIYGEKTSPILYYTKQFYALLIRELGLN